MEYVTLINAAISLAIKAIVRRLLAKRKLDEKMPGAPAMSPEERRELREHAFSVAVIPFPTEQEEQETK